MYILVVKENNILQYYGPFKTHDRANEYGKAIREDMGIPFEDMGIHHLIVPMTEQRMYGW